jgi:hypothetical protein
MVSAATTMLGTIIGGGAGGCGCIQYHLPESGWFAEFSLEGGQLAKPGAATGRTSGGGRGGLSVTVPTLPEGQE